MTSTDVGGGPSAHPRIDDCVPLVSALGDHRRRRDLCRRNTPYPDRVHAHGRRQRESGRDRSRRRRHSEWGRGIDIALAFTVRLEDGFQAVSIELKAGRQRAYWSRSRAQRWRVLQQWRG